MKLGARNAATGEWAASFLQINGDLSTGRRLGNAAAIDNGRVMVYGGATSTTLQSSAETFTPLAGSNRAPVARTTLPSINRSAS